MLISFFIPFAIVNVSLQIACCKICINRLSIMDLLWFIRQQHVRDFTFTWVPRARPSNNSTLSVIRNMTFMWSEGVHPIKKFTLSGCLFLLNSLDIPSSETAHSSQFLCFKKTYVKNLIELVRMEKLRLKCPDCSAYKHWAQVIHSSKHFNSKLIN